MSLLCAGDLALGVPCKEDELSLRDCGTLAGSDSVKVLPRDLCDLDVFCDFDDLRDLELHFSQYR